ncbi:hypothetical protein CCASEI_13350 [Corynebacterium casei LMG S-19264]|uniref:Uncharacterized protein n=1 Tax=Corynebacterium casei LMG S-19264 TaxID=1285583 RepID=A0ABN4CGH3_9CORY|nr:hypothetical protein CCASEI_13350 [Corynebacterium casei LMG S-19264]
MAYLLQRSLLIRIQAFQKCSSIQRNRHQAILPLPRQTILRPVRSLLQPGDLQHLQARKTTKSTKSRTKNSIPGVWKGGSLRQILKTKLLTVRCVPISKLSLRISVMQMQIGQSWPSQLWNQIARFLFRRPRDAQCIGHHGLKSVAQSELNTTPWVVHKAF